MREPHYADDAVTLYHGDCLDVLAELPDASVDAVVTDPPYGLEFMGKEWDKFSTGRGAKYAKGGEMTHTDFKNLGSLPQYVSRPAKRCADCGKQAWSGSPCQCENPRWVLDNSPLHAFQSWCELWAAECLRVLKPGGHMLAFGGTRTWHRLACAIEDAGFEIRDSVAWIHGQGFPKSHNLDGGLGTALKPAHEPVVVARKPLIGTVAANVERYGTGALNIAATRIAPRPGSSENTSGGTTPNVEGRWPANVVLDAAAAEELDRQSGERPAGSPKTGNGVAAASGAAFDGYADSGGASRFFYVAKAGSNERPRVGTGTEAGVHNNRCAKCGRTELSGTPCTCPEPEWIARTGGDVTAHPTVKPLALMRWLVRLVTPPGGIVLEPFAGSGTTAEACVIEGFSCIAIEREADYLPLIVQRLSKPIEPVMF